MNCLRLVIKSYWSSGSCYVSGGHVAHGAVPPITSDPTSVVNKTKYKICFMHHFEDVITKGHKYS